MRDGVIDLESKIYYMILALLCAGLAFWIVILPAYIIITAPLAGKILGIIWVLIEILAFTLIDIY